jgi:hypothetical protein
VSATRNAFAFFFVLLLLNLDTPGPSECSIIGLLDLL